MPDKNPDAGPVAHVGQLLRHTTPPGLKRWGQLRWSRRGDRGVGIGWRCGRPLTPRPGPRSGDPTVRSSSSNARRRRHLTLPGEVQAFRQRPDLCPGQRLCAEMVFRHRRAGEKRASCWPRSIRAPIRRPGSQATGSPARDSATCQCPGRLEPLSDAGGAERHLAPAARHPAATCGARPASSSRRRRSRRHQSAYTRIIAPFDGIVTSRAVDVGQSGDGRHQRHAAVHRADQSRLRIYVRVPQNYAPYIRPA
jgi:hypothetical protein